MLSTNCKALASLPLRVMVFPPEVSPTCSAIVVSLPLSKTRSSIGSRSKALQPHPLLSNAFTEAVWPSYKTPCSTPKAASWLFRVVGAESGEDEDVSRRGSATVCIPTPLPGQRVGCRGPSHIRERERLFRVLSCCGFLQRCRSAAPRERSLSERRG
jgi:hypothetical protein